MIILVFNLKIIVILKKKSILSTGLMNFSSRKFPQL